jgi:hypothetical protein
MEDKIALKRKGDRQLQLLVGTQLIWQHPAELRELVKNDIIDTGCHCITYFHAFVVGALTLNSNIGSVSPSWSW